MAVHLRYNSLYMSLRSSAKQQREMTNSALSQERELQRIFFFKFYFKLIAVFQIQFAIALIVINKVNDSRVSRD